MVVAQETKTRKPRERPTGTAIEKVRVIIAETVQALQGITDELHIKEIVTKAMLGMEVATTSKPSLGRHRTLLRDAIEEAYPSIETPVANLETQPAGYYFTQAGQGKGSRYEHLGLWYASTNKTRWSVVGDVAREQYFKDLPPLENESTTEQPTEQPVEQPTEQPVTPLTFETMTLEQLQLPSEIEATVSAALTHSGLSLPEFLKQAAKVYATTLVGRSSQASDDLSAIPTETLKTDKKYSTHPGRPAELVKRTIKAINLHNGACTMLKEKWVITQSLLVELTGSRPATVKDLVNGQFSTVIADYNAATFSELDDTQLRYWNRKDKSVPKPDLAALVPDGIDV